jgi:hypothetical protein
VKVKNAMPPSINRGVSTAIKPKLTCLALQIYKSCLIKFYEETCSGNHNIATLCVCDCNIKLIKQSPTNVSLCRENLRLYTLSKFKFNLVDELVPVNSLSNWHIMYNKPRAINI